MHEQSKRTDAFFTILIALMGWFAVIGQMDLMLAHREAPVLEALVRFFSFFTILTNILVAISFSFRSVQPRASASHFFLQPAVQTSVTVYMIFVAIVYHVLLSHIWNPSGMQWVIDQLLHTLVPTLCVIYWFIYTPKNNLKWRDALPWLIYPLIYLAYVLIRGALTGDYPYPFINVLYYGYTRVLWNSFALLVAFLMLSLLMIAISKSISGQSVEGRSL
jgi:hypothetical protein